MLEWFERTFRSAYLAELLADRERLRAAVDRLTADNRELINSALREAGARVELPSREQKANLAPRLRPTWDRYAVNTEHASAHRAAEKRRELLRQAQGATSVAV